MEEKRFTLRMDQELFDDIAALASLHRRSASKEVDCAIAEYVLRNKQDELLDGVDLDALSDEETRARLNELNKLRKKYARFS